MPTMRRVRNLGENSRNRIFDVKASEPKSSASPIAPIAQPKPGPEQYDAPKPASLLNIGEKLSRAIRPAEYHAAERGRPVHQARFGLSALVLGGFRLSPPESRRRYPCPGRSRLDARVGQLRDCPARPEDQRLDRNAAGVFSIPATAAPALSLIRSRRPSPERLTFLSFSLLSLLCEVNIQPPFVELKEWSLMSVPRSCCRIVSHGYAPCDPVVRVTGFVFDTVYY